MNTVERDKEETKDVMGLLEMRITSLERSREENERALQAFLLIVSGMCIGIVICLKMRII